MRTEVLAKLQNIADEKYRQFTAKLLPTESKLLGARIPELRRLAKQMIKDGGAEAYLSVSLAELEYDDEKLLYALILANSKSATDEKLQQIKTFVPYIKSWAVCDIFCADLKEIKKKPDFFYKEFLPYTQSCSEYQIRFFYVIALGYFITENLLDKIFTAIAGQQYVGFYDKMAVAWLLSVAYVKFPERTERFIMETPLDKFVFKKTISKIGDSFRVTKEAKIHLRTLASQKY